MKLGFVPKIWELGNMDVALVTNKYPNYFFKSPMVLLLGKYAFIPRYVC